MRELTLQGLSDDGRFVTARDAVTGERFRISADHRLVALLARAPIGGKRSGQLEIPMESSLTPREIQARIRRGESVEEVAAVAGVAFERVEGFAVPVIAERQHMVEMAQATSVRRKLVGGPAVTLAELVDEALAEHCLGTSDTSWDSAKREDNLWNVTVSFNGQTATFLFDPKSRYVIADDDAAQRLVGDLATEEQHDMALADVVSAAGFHADEPAADIRSLKEARDKKALESTLLESSDVEESIEEAQEPPMAVPDTPPVRKKASRRSVPSWDEIMFGGKSD